jgi:outer membrane immunogenic protein
MRNNLWIVTANEKENMATNNRKGISARRHLARLAAAMIMLTVAFCGAAYAQQDSSATPRIELSGAYSYMHGRGTDGGSFNLHGASASATYNTNRWLGFVADAGAYRFTNLSNGLDSTMYTYLFGPRFSLRSDPHVTVFAHVLIGGGRLTASSGSVSAGENGFVTALGGGLDLPVRHNLAIRVMQVDYLLTRFARADGSSATQSNIRVSAGIVFHFGTH